MSTASAPAPATVFAALGEPTRLSLVERLSAGDPLSIAALSTDTRLTRQAVTKHLRVLEKAGLVSNIRLGRESRFRFEPEAMADARAYLERVSGQWEDALSRLRAFVED